MHDNASMSLSKFRQHWLLAPNITFLNHGSFGACPKKVLDLQADLRRQMEAEPVQFLWRRYEERLEPSRRELARFIGARSRDVAFVTNATTAVNAVCRSIRFRPGDEILTTNQDYNACRNALLVAAKQTGARVRLAKIPFPIQSPHQVTEAVLRAVTSRTRLAMIDHITSSTALVFPVDQIIRQLQARGVDTLVDGAHAPGMVPLNLSRLRPAYYTGNLHKWVCAPKGAAFFWVREDKQSAVQPAVISHGNNTPRPGYPAFLDRFDWAGTFDPTAWFCVGEAIRFLSSLCPGGWNEIRRRNRQMAVAARRFLCEQLAVEPPCPEEMLGAMATLPLPERFQGRPRKGKIDAEQLRLYDECRIEVPFLRIGRPPRRYFRVSAQLYNSMADYEDLARSLSSL
jgi:isopenicillin-N epimerase